MKKFLKYFVAVILIIFFVFSIVPKELQNDTFYIVKLGEQIRASGLDRIDHYSWHKNLEYRYPHWLFDVVLSRIYDLFSWAGIYGFTCIMASITIVFIFFRMIKKDVSFLLAFIATIIVSYMLKSMFTGRAQVVSSLLFLIEIILIESFLNKENQKKYLTVIGMFFLSSLIANIHATAWIMMLILFLPYIAEQIMYLYSIRGVNERLLKRYTKKLNKLQNKQANPERIEKIQKEIEYQKEFAKTYKENPNTKVIIRNNEKTKWIWILILACVLGAMLTPIGSVPFTYYLKTSAGKTLGYISEHAPVIPATNLEFLAYTIILVAIIGFTDIKMNMSEGCLILGLYIMALSSVRNCYLMILLTSTIIVKMIDTFIKKNTDVSESGKNDKLKKISNIAFAISGIVVLGFGIKFFYEKKPEYINEKLYPIEATKYIKTELDYKNIKLYNEYDYGSYLLYEDIPVFLDSRCDLYTPEFNKKVTVFDDYMDVSVGNKTISSIMDKYGMDYAIISVRESEYSYAKEDSNFKQIYKDNYFAIFKYTSNEESNKWYKRSFE